MSFPLPANLQAIRKYYPDIHEKALAIRSKDRSLKYMASVWLAYYNIERPTCVREGCNKQRLGLTVPTVSQIIVVALAQIKIRLRSKRRKN